MGISTNKCKTFAQQMDGWKFQYKTKLEKKNIKKEKTFRNVHRAQKA